MRLFTGWHPPPPQISFCRKTDGDEVMPPLPLCRFFLVFDYFPKRCSEGPPFAHLLLFIRKSRRNGGVPSTVAIPVAYAGRVNMYTIFSMEMAKKNYKLFCGRRFVRKYFFLPDFLAGVGAGVRFSGVLSETPSQFLEPHAVRTKCHFFTYFYPVRFFTRPA